MMPCNSFLASILKRDGAISIGRVCNRWKELGDSVLVEGAMRSLAMPIPPTMDQTAVDLRWAYVLLTSRSTAPFGGTVWCLWVMVH